MSTRKIQPSESLTDKLLHAAEYERGISGHLIRGLVERLPNTRQHLASRRPC